MNLYGDEQINYVILLSGCDFFVTSREKQVDLAKHELEIEEKSRFYTPVYTIPKGWNNRVDDALRNFIASDFEKGFISREVYGMLGWSALDWQIYNCLKGDVRQKFTAVAQNVGVYSQTVKRHFYDEVLPQCVAAHYFFPQGYDFYRQMFLKIESEYETGIVKALETLPCTTYVLFWRIIDFYSFIMRKFWQSLKNERDNNC